MRGGEDELYEVSDLQARLAAYYRDSSNRHFPEDRVVIVDGRPGPDEVERAVWSIVEATLAGLGS